MAPLRPSRRSSRVSSPAVRSSSAAPSPRIGVQQSTTTTTTIDEAPSSDKQSTLDSWIEPPLRARTAFEDAGMEKSALFENMQPLGTLPNPAKLKYKLLNRATDKRPSFRPWIDNAASTPELTPPVEIEVTEETNGVVLPPSRGESVEKEAFPLLNGTHLGEPDASTPPLAHDEGSIATVSPRSPVRNDVPTVGSVSTPPALFSQEMPHQQTSTTPQAHGRRKTLDQPVVSAFSAAQAKLTEKVMADSVYNANQRAQIDGKEALGEAMVGLFQVAKQPDQRILYDALVAIFENKATPEQQHLFGISLKEQRAVAKRKLRLHVATSRVASTNSTSDSKTPETTQTSTPIINNSSTFGHAPSAPSTPVISQGIFGPPNPPMGSFHTTPSRPVVKTPLASLLRTPRDDQKPALITTTNPLQPSPKITSRKSSNAKAPGSPAILGKRRRDKADLATPESEVTPKAKRRAISDVTKEPEASHAGEVKMNGSTTRMTRARRSLGVTEPVELTKPVKTVPQTPPARTRSGRRRQSSSDLSSVDEEVANEEPQPPAQAVNKRTAAEAALDQFAEETERRRRPFDDLLAARKSEFSTFTQPSSIRSSTNSTKEQTLKINVPHGRTTRSGAQRQSQRAESSAPVTPGLPSPSTSAIFGLGATRVTRSSLVNAEHLLERKPPKPAGARFKTSPMKEPCSAAGVSRNTGYGSSPSRPGSPSRGKDDDMGDDGHSEYCLACGGGGKLICCDECTNAMHFKCCDPPIRKPSDFKNKPFFCHECKVQEQRHVDELNNTSQLLRPLFERLARTNTLSFQLPTVVQRYFEGVKAQDNGEYSDDTKKTVSLNRRNAAGWEELGENGRPRERDVPRLLRCKACGESSLSGRTIIQCDDCNAQWHLDCLDPPQANPPSVNNINRTRAFFRCPLHVDNDLRLIGNPRLAYAEADGLGERGHRLRKAKRARTIKPIVQRGNKNSGIIEVELEEEEEPAMQQDGVVYKLSESAIKLDFLEKAYAERALQQQRISRQIPSPAEIEAEIARRVEEQVAQRIAEFHQRQADMESAFLSRAPAEQDLLRSLVGLSQAEKTQLERENLDILTQAATVEEIPIASEELNDTQPDTSTTPLNTNDSSIGPGLLAVEHSALERKSTPDQEDEAAIASQVSAKEDVSERVVEPATIVSDNQSAVQADEGFDSSETIVVEVAPPLEEQKLAEEPKLEQEPDQAQNPEVAEEQVPKLELPEEQEQSQEQVQEQEHEQATDEQPTIPVVPVDLKVVQGTLEVDVPSNANVNVPDIITDVPADAMSVVPDMENMTKDNALAVDPLLTGNESTTAQNQSQEVAVEEVDLALKIEEKAEEEVVDVKDVEMMPTPVDSAGDVPTQDEAETKTVDGSAE